MKLLSSQIISVSRRTDIPAFYSEWFMNRIRAGYCTVPNPFNAKQVSYVSLKPQDVRAIVFWTRDPRPLIKYLPELDRGGYKYYFQQTIIGYPRSIDPKSPPVQGAVKTFQELSKLIGREKVIWRYDPILLSDIISFEWHVKRLSFLIERLKDYTNRLIISFIDPYRKMTTRMDREISAYNRLIKWIGKRAGEAGIEAQSCAEEADLKKYGITHGKCIDDGLIAKITDLKLILKKDPRQRKLCGCVVSKDIGVNNTCLFGCKYCYATGNITTAKKNFSSHNIKSPSLME
ncbi:MAG: DUF1848 domain-containing protein [Candidatus Omnitrophica bacterium]|nr:DUF1848 domain-containing protein [Candidatus Omnitrophota bacterium]